MATIKFTVVVTVLNEAATIDQLINSLINQTLAPDEIIIVDAGSVDTTCALINNFKQVKLIESPNTNRSTARNIGINAAQNKYIAVTDAGCIAHSDWLKNLSLRFTIGVESVAGFYLPIITKPLDRLFSLFVSTQQNEIDSSTYIPSSRSVAFTKVAWERAGKYPENVDTCEDLVFAQKLRSIGVMKVSPEAVVYWRQAQDYYRFYRQIKGYAQGDIEARYKPHLWKISTVWLRYILFIVYPPLFLLYLLLVLFKFEKRALNLKLRMQLPLVQITADIGVLMGSISGLVSRKTL